MVEKGVIDAETSEITYHHIIPNETIENLLKQMPNETPEERKFRIQTF